MTFMPFRAPFCVYSIFWGKCNHGVARLPNLGGRCLDLACDLIISQKSIMYKFDFPPVVLSFQPQPSTDILLMPSNESAQYLSLYNSSPPRSRRPSGISASIWAPQPQPSDITWPKTLDSFSRVVERDSENFQPLEAKNVPLISREDIFGPSENPNNARPKDVGAIGDGRKKNSPDFDSSVRRPSFFPAYTLLRAYFQHVEQLLRTLNLNSPAPFTKKPAITLGVDTSPSSPDFSPASATSSLLTPTDLSPPRPFDLKLQNPYDLGQSIQYVPQNSLLFEQSPINRAQDPSPLSAHTAPYRSQFSQSSTCLPTTSGLQFFEPFSEPPTPAPTAPQSAFNTLPNSIAQSLYALSPTRRMESRRPSVMDWRLASQLHQHQLLTQTQPDWMIPGDKATSELNLGDFNQDDHLRSSMLFRQHTSTNNSSSAHEVRFIAFIVSISRIWMSAY